MSIPQCPQYDTETVLNCFERRIQSSQNSVQTIQLLHQTLAHFAHEYLCDLINGQTYGEKKEKLRHSFVTNLTSRGWKESACHNLFDIELRSPNLPDLEEKEHLDKKYFVYYAQTKYFKELRTEIKHSSREFETKKALLDKQMRDREIPHFAQKQAEEEILSDEEMGLLAKELFKESERLYQEALSKIQSEEELSPPKNRSLLFKVLTGDEEDSFEVKERISSPPPIYGKVLLKSPLAKKAEDPTSFYIEC